MSEIEARELVKRYGDLVAVGGVSFAVTKGEIFGLLGPNGAGKTTVLDMLEGLRVPDGGSASIFDLDVVKDARRIKARIGVQLQATSLPAYTKVRETLDLFGAFYPAPRPTDELLTEFDLVEKADAFATDLSGGQLQRLSIALALINDPDVVFLDEPTTGLDPQARLNLWDVIESVRARGKTVVLTTHYMEEAERLCDRVGVMDHGLLVALETPSHLVAQHAPGTSIEFDAPEGVWEEGLLGLAGVESVKINTRVTIHTRAPEQVLRDLLDPAQLSRWVRNGDHGVAVAGHTVRELRLHQGTLEDVFINLTGRGLRG